MMSASNIRFKMAERSRAVNYGGIGAIHLMGQKLGLAQEIDGRVQLFKRHLPYHESDHVLNPAYNALLETAVELYDAYQLKIMECEAKVERQLQQFETKQALPSKTSASTLSLVRLELQRKPSWSAFVEWI